LVVRAIWVEFEFGKIIKIRTPGCFQMPEGETTPKAKILVLHD
jgi:hypothetical protein